MDMTFLADLIQDKSLLNDATAIALFSFFLTLVAIPNAEIDSLKTLLDVPLSVAGGLGSGLAGHSPDDAGSRRNGGMGHGPSHADAAFTLRGVSDSGNIRMLERHG